MDHLTQFRVARFFIKTMRPFSQCEDANYPEQAATDWVACYRDTMRGTIGECFLVTAEEVKLALRPVLKRSVITLVISMLISGQEKSATKSFWVCVSFGNQDPT